MAAASLTNQSVASGCKTLASKHTSSLSVPKGSLCSRNHSCVTLGHFCAATLAAGALQAARASVGDFSLLSKQASLRSRRIDRLDRGPDVAWPEDAQKLARFAAVCKDSIYLRAIGCVGRRDAEAQGRR